MPFYLNSSVWDAEYTQKLAELHLPGPAVVIDVRQGSELDPPLVWDIALELEDFTAEMQQNHIFRWRHFKECVDFLKLAHFGAQQPVQATHDFVITTSNGEPKTFSGAKDLLEELRRYHLDRVRNNRISAVRDRGKNIPHLQIGPTSPEKATVSIFFLVDAEDTDSLICAATYAEWLKAMDHEYDEPGRSGHEHRLNSVAICMNADPHLHHPRELTRHLGRISAITGHPALDTIILIQTYGDDEAYIGQDIQAYQVESILYALLMLAQDSLIQNDQNVLEDQRLSTFVYNDTSNDSSSIPWPIYMIGISSLEHSARWGTRWLDYGLVTKIFEVMQNAKLVNQEHQQGRFSREVHEHLSQWQEDVRELVANELLGVIPELQALDSLQGLVSTPVFGKSFSTSLADFDLFCQRIKHLYRGDGHTLESAINYAPLLFAQLQNDFLLFAQSDHGSSTDEMFQKLAQLRTRAMQLPATLFHGAEGMIPRMLHHLTAIKDAVQEIQQKAEILPDLQDLQAEFASVRQQVRQTLAQSQRKRSIFASKQRQQRAMSIHKMIGLVNTHIHIVQAIIASRVMLALLEEAGLYAPDNKVCAYHQRFKHFEAAILKAQARAEIQQETAYERLKLSLSEMEIGISQNQPWLSLTSRRDLLNWEQISETFKHLSTNLESAPTSLNLLSEWLLRLISTEKPHTITQQYLNKIQSEVMLQSQEEAKVKLQVLSTILVDILLTVDVVDFDITTIQPLLTQYVELNERASSEPSALENNILRLQHSVKEALVAQITHNTQKQLQNGNFRLKQDQPIESVLASWVSHQYAEDPQFASLLARDGIIARLKKHKISADRAFDDLRERNRVLGYREAMSGDDQYFLLLPPGDEGNDFLKELDLLHSSQIRAIHFPDREKLIYLHLHRIRYLMPSYPILQHQITCE